MFNTRAYGIESQALVTAYIVLLIWPLPISTVYISYLRVSVTAKVEFTHFHAISNICATFHITSWTTRL